MIVDQYGRAVKTRELREEHARPSLTGIRQAWSGESLAYNITPQRLARIMQSAAEGDAYDMLTLAEEMEERDPHYASVLSTRKRAVAGIEPSVEAASDDAHDVELADAVRALLDRHATAGLVTDLLDALGKGFAACEILWETHGGHWTPATYAWRDPRWFVFGREDGHELRLLTDDGPFEGVPLAPYKFIVHMPHMKSGLPIRNGLARLAATSWMCKAYTLSDWMAYAETYGKPLRVGRYGGAASEADRQVLATAVANLGTDAAAVLPDSMRVEFVEASKGTGGHQLYLQLAEFLDRQMSKAVLGQTMTADDGSSQAQASVHNEVRLDIRTDDARQVSATLNRDLVRPYIDLNYGPHERYPRIVIAEAEAEDVEALTRMLNAVVPLGLTVEAREVRERLGFGEPGDDADVLGLPAQEASDNTEMTAQNRAQNSAQNRAEVPSSPTADELDAALDEELTAELGNWEEVVQPIADPVERLLAECESLEEFGARLPELLERMDDSELVARLATLTFKARGAGDAG